MKFILRWLVTAAAVWAATYFVEGITYDGSWQTLLVVALPFTYAGTWPALLLVAVVFGLVNAGTPSIVKDSACGILLILPLAILSINALVLLLTSFILRQVGFGFHVDGFVAALLGSTLISVVALFVSNLLAERND